MRSISFLSYLTVLSLALECAAAPPPPPLDAIGPATQSGTSILILPFSSPPGNDLYHWVGPAIQHVVAADASHGSVMNVLAPATAQPAADADAALVAGRNNGASFVVFGETQLVEREVRITGEMIDVSAGRSIGGLKATGNLNDLFHLEDGIGSQVIAALPASLREEQTPQTVGPEQPSAGQSQPYAPGPTTYDNGGYYSSGYTYPSSGYAYTYPSYTYYPSYSYPYYPYSYYPYGFYGAFFFDGHDHHDDHHDGHHDDHHDFHDGHHNDFHSSDFHNGHNDFSHGWSGSSSGRNFTGATRSPGFNRSTFGMNSSPANRGGGFQSAPRSSMGGATRGFSGAGMPRGFAGGGMSRGGFGGGMAHGGAGGGMHGGGGHR